MIAAENLGRCMYSCIWMLYNRCQSPYLGSRSGISGTSYQCDWKVAIYFSVVVELDFDRLRFSGVIGPTPHPPFSVPNRWAISESEPRAELSQLARVHGFSIADSHQGEGSRGDCSSALEVKVAQAICIFFAFEP